MKLLILSSLIIIFSSSSLWSQKEKKILKGIQTLDEIREYNIKNDDYELTTYNIHIMDERELEPDAASILKLNNGIFNYNGRWMKEIKRSNYTGSNVRYIYFSLENMELDEMNTLRDSVLELYNSSPNDANFADLANEFTMDGNTDGGLLNWYNPKRMVKKFSNKVIAADSKSVFKIDIPDRNWYYLVYKLNDEREIEIVSFVIANKN